MYSYLRFSRPEQLKGDSQRRQVENSRSWAERKGLSLDDSLDLRDLGVSAFRGKNAKAGALSLFLEAMQAGRVRRGDFLVIENLDRLSRAEVFSVALPLVQRIIGEGVTIVTLDPERVYSPATVQDIGPLLEMVLAMHLANEESRKKSVRLGEAWANKRRRASAVKLTARCPEWLRLNEDRTAFVPIPERVEVVRRIFRMTADGCGGQAIVKRLNAEGVPPFRAVRDGSPKETPKFWQPSYVKKLIANRSVLGEFQPHRLSDGRRVPTGDSIPGYFPAILTEAQFYAASAARESRRGKGGRNGDRVTNLFSGLLRDARDGSPLTIVNKGAGPTVVSSAARAGANGAGPYMSFPYAALERALLVWGYDLPLADAAPRRLPQADAELSLKEVEEEVADLESRMAKVKERMRTAPSVDALLDIVVDLEGRLKAKRAEVERRRAEAAAPTIAEAADGLRALIGAVRVSEGADLLALRLKLRQLLARLVQDIVVLTVDVGGVRVAVCDVLLRSDVRRRVTVCPGGAAVRLPAGLSALDIRKWREWPEEWKAARFAGETENARRIRELHAAGMNRGDIGAFLRVSLSEVSRTLIRAGRRKQSRKRVDSERLMNWHEGGRGWAKTYRGGRYFVGLGKLTEAFPALIRERTAEGTWEAANAWWTAKRAELDAPK